MKNVDLSSLIECDNKYEKMCLTLAGKFKSEWDDEVHESFHRFVVQIHDNGRRLHSARTTAELISKAVDSLDIDEVIKKAQQLMREAKSL